jgi:TetR/AcrR family transcriptional regulator of autoinduction and epiphytic fitness
MSQSANPHDPRVARSRAAILEAGVDLLVEGGPNAVTIEAVVQRSGVAKTTVYRHWESREDLVVDVIGEVVKSAPAPAADVAFEPALRTMMRAQCSQACDDRVRRAFPALLLANAQGQFELDRLRSRSQHNQTAQIEALLERGVAEGSIGPGVTMDDVMLQLMAPLVLLTCGVHEFDDDVADRIVDLFLASHRP